MSTTTHSSPPASERSEVAWRSWPPRDAAPASWLAAPALVGALLLVRAAADSWLLAALAGLALAASLWRFFLPIRYVVNGEGVGQEAFGRRRWIAWSSVGSYEIRRRGLMLYAVAEPLGLDVFRGLYLPCGHRGPEILGLLPRHVRRAKL